MRRLLTLAGVVLIAGLAFGLYKLKYEVQQLEDRYADVNRAIAAEQEAIRVLKAEWSYLNSPTRLSSLVERHLKLEPPAAERILTLGEIPSLPATASSAAQRLPVRLPVDEAK